MAGAIGKISKKSSAEKLSSGFLLSVKISRDVSTTRSDASQRGIRAGGRKNL